MAQIIDLELSRTTTQAPAEEPPQSLPPRKQRSGKKTWKKPLLIGAGAVVLVALIVVGLTWGKRGAITVQTGKIQRQDLTSIVTASGEIKPPTEKFVSVNANSFGKIVEIHVKEGDQVKKGQLLLKTESVQQDADVQAQEAALRTAEADVLATEAAVESSAAALKTAQADLQTAQARFNQAKDDFVRAQQLLKDNLIAQQVFDQRRSEYLVAQATLEGSQARVAQAKAQHEQATFTRNMARARVGQSRAAVVRAKDQRSKTVYTSPLDGVVTSLPVREGENVVPGIQNQPGSLLFQISDLSVITAQVKVDEADIINVTLGQPAEVTIDAIPNKTFKGKVTEIGQSALSRTTGLTTTSSSTTSEEAKDFKVVVTLDEPPPGLRPGLSATAKITTATKKDVLTIPIQALTIRQRRELEPPEQKGSQDKGKALAAAAAPAGSGTSGEKAKDKGKEELQGVFAVRGGKAVFVPVETGIMGTTDIEITKGAQQSEEIVTGSFKVLRTLKNNAKVKVDNRAAGEGKGPASS